jgi:CRP/FNR family cyclic AMP-dependent transcriptional regulator
MMSDHTPPQQEEDRLRLAGHRLLQDVESGAREALIDRFHVADVPAGRSLLEEGQTNSRLFIVLKGSVSVKLPKRANRVSEVKLATLVGGDIFGEYSLFDGRPVSATVFAVQATRVAWLEKSALDAFVDRHPEAGRRVYESIARILVDRLRTKDAELDIVTIG